MRSEIDRGEGQLRETCDRAETDRGEGQVTGERVGVRDRGEGQVWVLVLTHRLVRGAGTQTR